MKTKLASVLLAASLMVAIGPAMAAGAGLTAKTTATSTAQPKSKLAKAYALSTGQFVALIVPGLINNFHLVDVPVLAAYDSDEDKIGILLFGQRGTVDAAKQAIDDFQERAVGPISSLVELTYDLKLDPEDFYLAYYDVSKDKLVLEWKDGEYKMH